MQPPPSRDRRLFLALVSAALLAYQLLLTRIFSALFAYHYAFLVSSLSLCGLGLGAAGVYRFRTCPLWRPLTDAALARLGFAFAAFVLSALAAISLLPFLGSVLAYVALSWPPCLLGGAMVTAIFREPRAERAKLYAADLLGAGLGALGAVLCLDALGMLRTALAVAFLPLAASCWLTRSVRTLGAAALALSALLGLGASRLAELERNYRPLLSAPGKLPFEMNAGPEGLGVRVASTRWDAFARTDVLELAAEPDRKALTIDGVGYSGIYRFSGDLARLDRYPDTAGYLPTIAALPFALADNRRVLSIGSGGGRDVLLALRARAEHVDAVEINAASIAAVRSETAFAGNLYDRADVSVYRADGRGFVARSRQRYDVILLSLLKTEASGAVGLSLAEDYLLTAEALALYYEHLNERGRIAFFLHHEPELVKLTATALAVLRDHGVPERERPLHLAVFQSKNLTPHGELHQPLLLVSKAALGEPAARTLAEAAEAAHNLIGYLPYVREDGELGSVRAGRLRAADFGASVDYNAQPARDDCPFFYRFDQSVPEQLGNALAGILALVTLVALPLLWRTRARAPAARFALLGAAFMLIETPLIQKYALYLGHPTLAFVTVVCTLLGFGGLGSQAVAQGRIGWVWLARPLPPLMVALAAAALWTLAGLAFPVASGAGPALRVALAVLLLAPLGFLLGMPFSSLLAQSERDGSRELPLCLALNGLCAVLGSVLSVTVSMYFGLSYALGLGAALYLLAFAGSRA